MSFSKIRNQPRSFSNNFVSLFCVEEAANVKALAIEVDLETMPFNTEHEQRGRGAERGGARRESNENEHHISNETSSLIKKLSFFKQPSLSSKSDDLLPDYSKASLVSMNSRNSTDLVDQTSSAAFAALAALAELSFVSSTANNNINLSFQGNHELATMNSRNSTDLVDQTPSAALAALAELRFVSSTANNNINLSFQGNHELATMNSINSTDLVDQTSSAALAVAFQVQQHPPSIELARQVHREFLSLACRFRCFLA